MVHEPLALQLVLCLCTGLSLSLFLVRIQPILETGSLPPHRANCDSSVVYAPSSYLYSQTTYLEAPLSCLLHATRPNEEVSQQTTIYGICARCRPSLDCHSYVINLFIVGLPAHVDTQWSLPHQQLMISCRSWSNARSYPPTAVACIHWVTVLSLFSRGHKQWRRLGLGPSHTSTSEPVFVAVQVSDLCSTSSTVANSLYLEQPSASDGTSLSSGNSAVPVSAKSTRPKRVKSDEDVWNFPDTKIIGIQLGLSCILLISRPIVQNSARSHGSQQYMTTMLSLLNGVMRNERSPSDSLVGLTLRDIPH